MGTDHGKNKKNDNKKKVKAPLKKPKGIDQIGKTSKKATKKQTQTTKPKVREALKKSRQAKESSKKTTITDTQKRGQVRQRYDLYDGTKRPLKKPTKKPPKKEKETPSNNSRIIKPLYIPPEEKQKKKSGVMA